MLWKGFYNKKTLELVGYKNVLEKDLHPIYAEKCFIIWMNWKDFSMEISSKKIFLQECITKIL